MNTNKGEVLSALAVLVFFILHQPDNSIWGSHTKEDAINALSLLFNIPVEVLKKLV